MVIHESFALVNMPARLRRVSDSTIRDRLMVSFSISQPLLEGFFLGLSLIAAIGAQNLFVLRQGIKGEYVMTTAVTSSLCDFAMIGIGTLGAGSLVARIPLVRQIAVSCGIVFLVYYGFKSCLNLIQGRSLQLVALSYEVPVPRKTVVLSAMGFSLLNPHAVLDGVVLIGGLSGQYEQVADRATFAAGAGSASVLWFFCLGYGAKMLGPLFRRPTFAKAFDVLIAGIMFGIAWSLMKAEFLAS